MNEIRVGKVSSINYPAGMVKVTYTDKDNSTTQEIPLLNVEYKMPPVGAQVLVINLSNGGEVGFVLGRPWSEVTKPVEGFEGLYRKELSNNNSEAYVRYVTGQDFQLKLPKATISVDNQGNINIEAQNININSKEGTTTTSKEACKVESEQGYEMKAKGISMTDTAIDKTITAEQLSNELETYKNSADTAKIEKDNIELKCSAGSITVAELLKMKEMLGL